MSSLPLIVTLALIAASPSVSFVVLLFLAAGSLFMTYILVWPWLESMINATRRRVEDISGRGTPIPEGVQAAIHALEGLGFHRIGETVTHVRNVQGESWYLVDGEGTTLAEVVSYGDRAIAGFSTTLSDGSVAETSYGIGEKIRTAEFVVEVVRTSLADAYARHRQTVESFQARRSSPPRHAATIADALDLERIYRARHFARKLRPGFVRSAAMMIALNAALAGSIWMVHALRPPITITPRLVAVFAVSGICLMVFFILLYRVIRHASL
jgi:hypothetical protein